MFVKICGITRVEDARAACAAGASALGFVFWPKSPRSIEPDKARAIIESIPSSIESVGVFVDRPVNEVNDIARAVGLTRVQLHGDESAADAARIDRPVIKAVSLDRGGLPPGPWRQDMMWLIDAHDPELRGGTGRRADWSAAAAVAATRRVLLAGGLTPATVGEAIARVRPFGIDVSSGVESAPGLKDHRRLEALFEALDAIHLC
jgi:phosphoribosylanthranilate isomerase